MSHSTQAGSIPVVNPDSIWVKSTSATVLQCTPNSAWGTSAGFMPTPPIPLLFHSAQSNGLPSTGSITPARLVANVRSAAISTAAVPSVQGHNSCVP